MSLKAKLKAIHEASANRIPADKRAIMAQATKDQRESGMLSQILSVGQKAPDFTGVSHDGRSIAFGDLLGRGPVVLSFFRGHW